MRLEGSRLLLRVAAGAALAGALVLAGCGRKSGLDPPPATTYAEPAVAGQPMPEEIGPDGRPLPPRPRQAPQNRWTPIDWLIN